MLLFHPFTAYVIELLMDQITTWMKMYLVMKGIKKVKKLVWADTDCSLINLQHAAGHIFTQTNKTTSFNVGII